MGNPVVHFEINTADAPALGKFYSDLFGWHPQSLPEMNYVSIDTHAGGGIGGGFSNADEQRITFYVEVPDPAATLTKIESLGGKTLVPPTEMPGVVTFAVFSDPEGNAIGLVKEEPAQEGQGISSGSNPPVAWFEVLGRDVKALWSFYTEAFGWTIKDEGGQGAYGDVDTGSERGIPGGIGAIKGPLRPEDGVPTVMFYAKVEDLKKYIDRSTKLGAKTVIDPVGVGEGTTIAVIEDPQGNRVGIFTSKS